MPHMGRTRESNRELPPRVYLEHGAYYFRPRNGKRVPLGREFVPAMREWARIVERPDTDAGSELSVFMDKYLLEVVPGKAARTQQNNHRELRTLRQVFGHMSPTAVRPVHIYQYLDARKAAPVYANREVALLSHLFTKLIEWGVVETNPCHRVRRHVEKSRDRIPSATDLAAMADQSPFIAAYIELKELTGLRQSDLLSLPRDAVNDLYGIQVKTRKTGKKLIIRWTPGLAAAVRAIIALPHRQGATLLRTRTGAQYTDTGFRAIWQRYMAKAVAAGIERYTEHDIRAKTATDDPANARVRLGHKNQSMTDAYIRDRDVEYSTPLR